MAAYLTVTSCATGVGNEAESGVGDSIGSPQTLVAAWHAALTASDTPPLVVTAYLQGQIGDWDNAVGGNNKSALLSGQVEAGLDVAAQPRPTDQTVSWANGQHRTIPVMTAASAIATLVAAGADGGCSGCEPDKALVLHDPKLIRQRLSTATGPATIPVWSFAVTGSKVRVTVVAVPRSSLVRPVLPGLTSSTESWDPSVTAHELSDGSLVITFVGAAAGTGPCTADYSARLFESAHTVAVIIDQTGTNDAGGDGSCAAIGYERTVRVRPGSPLGARPVINGHIGLALPLT